MTKRQAVLLDRLVTYCARCGSPDLPMRVDRVIGYGSFFRGKPNPDDVDLVAIVGRLHPGFERFRDLVEDELKEREGKGAPEDRMRQIARSHRDPQIRARADLYAGWLEGITDRWLYEQTTILGDLLKISPFCYADRILRRDLPRIRARLTNFADECGAKVSHEIWTPERLDIRAIVEAIWGSDHRAELITEAEWFEEQARIHLLQIAVLDAIAARLRASRVRAIEGTEHEAIKRFHAWLGLQDLGFPLELCIKATKMIIDDAEGEMLAIPGYEPPDFTALETPELARVVEEKRESLWELRRRVFVLRLIIICLALWCFRDKKTMGGKRGWHIVGEAAKWIPKRSIPPERAFAMLDEGVERLGLW